LGRYKFYLPNDDSIYLHSTSKPSLFNHDLRAISSGCVRVEQSADLAELLLKDSKWSKDKLDAILQSKATKWVPLNNPVPVYTVYWRSWVDAQGLLQFRDDIYGFDSGKIDGNGPVMRSLRRHQKA
jgi:murein L,D-transpeptidase YcbB/YkuD